MVPFTIRQTSFIFVENLVSTDHKTQTNIHVFLNYIHPKLIQMEPSIKVYSKTNKHYSKFIIKSSLLNLQSDSSCVIQVFISDNLILQNCVFHEIDIITTQSIETEEQALLVVAPFIHKRLLCKDGFCLFLTYYKLDIKKKTNKTLCHSCYKDTKHKRGIINLYTSKSLIDIVYWMDMVSIEYKIHYITSNLHITSGMLNSVNIDVMVYNHKIYFYTKTIDFFIKKGHKRKAFYYQVRLYLTLCKERDFDFKKFALDQLEIEGKNWTDVFTGNRSIALQLNISSDAKIIKHDSLYVPQMYKNQSNTVYCLSTFIIECSSNIYIKYIETERGHIYVYQKSAYFVIPVEQSVILQKVTYLHNNKEYKMDVNHVISKIDTDVYLKRKWGFDGLNTNSKKWFIEYETNVSDISIVSDNAEYKIENNILKISVSNEQRELCFRYKLNDYFSCEVCEFLE